MVLSVWINGFSTPASFLNAVLEVPKLGAPFAPSLHR